MYDTTFYVNADIPGLPGRNLLPRPSYLEGASEAVKMHAMSMGLGVTRGFYYLHNGTSGPRAYHSGTSMETTRAPKPKLMAMVAMDHLTRGAKLHTLVEQNELTGLVLAKGASASLAVLWADGHVSVAPPPGALVFDLFGNRIKPVPRQIAVHATPTYIQAPMPAADLAALTRSAG